MPETTPEDQLIILCEFLAGNKAHTTSSSIMSLSKFLESVSKLLMSECKVTSELYHSYITVALLTHFYQ